MHRERVIDQEHSIWQGFLRAAAHISVENNVGKVLATTRYLHRSVLRLFSLECNDIDRFWIRLTDNTTLWNLVRVDPAKEVLALLSYPGFQTIAHPQLAYSVSVDLITRQVAVTDFTQRTNPPILHRKELFLHPTYPEYETFRSLTIAEEQAGLLTESRKIGYTRQWLLRLQEYQHSIEGHLLKNTANHAD